MKEGREKKIASCLMRREKSGLGAELRIGVLGSDVRMVPSYPTAINWLPVQVTVVTEPIIEVLGVGVQVIPSGEVMMPSIPRATSWLPVHVREKIREDVPDVLGVHVRPSGEVRTVPFIPTATNWLPVQTTVLSSVGVPEFQVLWVQVIPSGMCQGI